MREWDEERIEYIASQIVDASVKIHKALGPGLLESVYVRILVRELFERGLRAKTEVPVHVVWDGEDLGPGYRVDILVEGLVVIEVKSVKGDSKIHCKQALTYLKLLHLPLAIVANFHYPLMADGLERVANGYFPNRK